MAARTTKAAVPQVLDEPTGRLAKLITETNMPEPYVVSDKIAIRPLSKDDRTKLREIETRSQMARLVLAAMMQLEKLPSETDIVNLNQIIKDADDESNRLFFGDQHDAVMAFFANRPPHLWDAFCGDIRKQFLPSLPATGRCPHCSQVIDLEQVGKDHASSI